MKCAMRSVACLTVFCFLAAASFAAKGAGKEPGRVLKTEAKELKRGGSMSEAIKMAAKFAAKEAGLDADKTEKFVAAYASEREAAVKQMNEARKAKDREKAKAASEESAKALEKVFSDNLSADQVKKVKEMDLEGLERSVAALYASRVEPAKIEQALPVLGKYHKEVAALMAKAKSREIQKQDVQTKAEALQAAAVKDLKPVVGDDAAARWQQTFKPAVGKTREAGAGKEKPADRVGKRKRGDEAKPAKP